MTTNNLPNNYTRSLFAGKAINAYMNVTGCDIDTAVYDLLGDILHYCDYHRIDFYDELDKGRDHYEEEVREEREERELSSVM